LHHSVIFVCLLFNSFKNNTSVFPCVSDQGLHLGHAGIDLIMLCLV